MNRIDPGWEQRFGELWSSMDQYDPELFVAEIEKLAAELPSESAVGLFERGSSQDSTGHSDLAIPLYQSALKQGLTGIRRRRACIQLASSLRNLGRSEESVELLSAELDATPDELNAAF
jgi:tetratricopeptide (TPR) repeat protein